MIIMGLVIIFLQASTLMAELGCMDYSKHTYTADGYDYKKFYFTRCNCPCWRYFHSFKRGRCERCGHYRAPGDIPFTYRDIPKYPTKKVNYDSCVACGPCKKRHYAIRNQRN